MRVGRRNQQASVHPRERMAAASSVAGRSAGQSPMDAALHRVKRGANGKRCGSAEPDTGASRSAVVPATDDCGFRSVATRPPSCEVRGDRSGRRIRMIEHLYTRTIIGFSVPKLPRAHGQVQLRGASAPTCQDCGTLMIPFRVFCGRCSRDLQVPVLIRPLATFRGRATNVDWRDLGSLGLDPTNSSGGATLVFNLEVADKNLAPGQAQQVPQGSTAAGPSQAQQAYQQSAPQSSQNTTATYVSVVAENAARCVTEGVYVEVTGVINESGILLPLELRNLLTKAYAVKLL